MNQLANFGVCIFPTEHILTPSQIAIIAEKNNLDYLFLAENSHIPITNTAKKYYSNESIIKLIIVEDMFTYRTIQHLRLVIPVATACAVGVSLPLLFYAGLINTYQDL